MKKYLKKVKNVIFASTASLAIPFIALAQFSTGTTACDPDGVGLLGSDFSCSLTRARGILDIVFPILVSLSFIAFFWGLSQFILHSDNKAELDNGKKYMIWGIVALFILITFMAIIRFIMGDLGFGGNPTVNGVLLNTGTN